MSATTSAAVSIPHDQQLGQGLRDAPRNAVCVPCKQRRGHACFAHKMVGSEPWCEACLSDQPCAWERKQKAATTLRTLEKSDVVETEEVAMTVETAEPKKSSGNGHPATSGSAHQAERICAKPGCGTVLGEKNRSGWCHKHFHLSPNGGHAARKNGHHKNGSAAPKLPSSPKAGNGHLEPTLAPEMQPDRVDHLLLSLPITQKTRLAEAWLSGKI